MHRNLSTNGKMKLGLRKFPLFIGLVLVVTALIIGSS